jgi:transposase-like protein
MSSILNGRSWTAEEKARITNLLDEGKRVLSDIDILKYGLKDTVSSIAEEYEIPKRTLNKAIRAYYKDSIETDKEAVSEVEEILTITGRA